MFGELQNYWRKLQDREQLIVLIGGIVALVFIVYMWLWQPWRAALNHMEATLPVIRENLTWMRQQSDALDSAGMSSARATTTGAEQSLMAILEQTARRAQVRSSIQQMIPANNGREVRVVMDEANFNQWLRWVDGLYRQNGVSLKQLSAERDDDQPNVAEIRATFERQ